MYAHLHEFIYVHFSDQISVGDTETSWYLKPAGIYILQKKKKIQLLVHFPVELKVSLFLFIFIKKVK